MKETEDLTSLKGIGPKNAERFNRAGIRNVEDLLSYYPRAYEMLEEPLEKLPDGCEGTTKAVIGFVPAPLAARYAGKYQITSGHIQTKECLIPVIWYNMPYLRSSVKPGRWYVFRGYAGRKGKNLTLLQPRLYDPEEYEKKRASLQPVYPLSEGLTENMLRKAIRQAVDRVDPAEDALPDWIRQEYGLISYAQAVESIHFPRDPAECARARTRLAFEEFLLFTLAVRTMKAESTHTEPAVRLRDTGLCRRVIDSLPYRLTDAQRRAWQQVSDDLSSDRCMARLLQGDVGSGKTVIAFLALLFTADNGAQGALMAPTEVLARQHYEAFCRLCADLELPVQAVLLTGSMNRAQKEQAREKLLSGEALVAIGTHALFQEKVRFARLALVITDEQHRFGVRQREALAEKGVRPHTLVMSATPIPRTLAVILYADLDLSVIDQMPAGRKKIKNCVIGPDKRKAAWHFIGREVFAGHQAYVICPMVEESQAVDAENVTDYTKILRDELGSGVRVECLHGRMKSEEKNQIMERFAGGEIQVLVSTTVVEVGVNVPGATVMMIEDAQRFGLSALHQLRGRVGRGQEQGYCILVDGSADDHASQRLEILKQTDDGFEIARKDMQMRGPGDLFGVRQSGQIDLKIADVFADSAALQHAGEAADRLLAQDAHLEAPENRKLLDKLTVCMKSSTKNVNI